jgi:hypothetical protein
MRCIRAGEAGIMDARAASAFGSCYPSAITAIWIREDRRDEATS